MVGNGGNREYGSVFLVGKKGVLGEGKVDEV